MLVVHVISVLGGPNCACFHQGFVAQTERRNQIRTNYFVLPTLHLPVLNLGNNARNHTEALEHLSQLEQVASSHGQGFSDLGLLNLGVPLLASKLGC